MINDIQAPLTLLTSALCDPAGWTMHDKMPWLHTFFHANGTRVELARINHQVLLRAHDLPVIAPCWTEGNQDPLSFHAVPNVVDIGTFSLNFFGGNLGFEAFDINNWRDLLTHNFAQEGRMAKSCVQGLLVGLALYLDPTLNGTVRLSDTGGIAIDTTWPEKAALSAKQRTTLGLALAQQIGLGRRLLSIVSYPFSIQQSLMLVAALPTSSHERLLCIRQFKAWHQQRVEARSPVKRPPHARSRPVFPG